MTILIVAMQDLVLLLESSKTGWKTRESLKGTHPQSVTFDPRNPNRAFTLWLYIKRRLKASTLLQATAILKALITESLGRGQQLGLSIITFTDLLLIRLIPTLLLYRHLNRPGEHIPLKARIH